MNVDGFHDYAFLSFLHCFQDNHESVAKEELKLDYLDIGTTDDMMVIIPPNDVLFGEAFPRETFGK